MRQLKMASGFAIFALFFGAAMVNALVHREWPMSAVYVVLGLLFLGAAGRKPAAGTER